MISGAMCWNLSRQRGMGTHRVGTHDYHTFDDAPQTLFELLEATAARTPEAAAIVDDELRRIRYEDLLAHTRSFASYLSHVLGVCAGCHVGLLMRAETEFVVSLFAISCLGAVCVPLPTKDRQPEIATLMKAARLDVLIAGDEFAAWEMPLAPDRCVFVGQGTHGDGLPEDQRPVSPCGDNRSVAIMMFTSGTTSHAKGVMLTNLNLIHAAMVYQRLVDTTEGDSCLIPIPIYHVTGLVALLLQFIYAGATVYLHRAFDARRVLETIKSERITYLHATPTVFEELLSLRAEHPSLPSVRMILSGSSYQSIKSMKAVHEWMPTATFKVVYGLTETSSPALLFPHDAPTSIYAGATGKPVPGIEAKIVDENGREVALGETGELLVRGACVTPGYFEREGEGFVGEWLATGDVARADEEGMVWVVGRKKEMINRGGEKVWCNALEETLCEVNGVRASCVVGLEDALYGEVPAAVVVPEEGHELTERGIQEALRLRIARYKIPAHIAFVDAIPLTDGGKPDRRAARAIVMRKIGVHQKEVSTHEG